MELSYGLFICFLLWGGTELCYPHPLWLFQGGTHRPVSSPPPVLVQCLEAQMVVTVSKDLFGTGKLIRPADLTLGWESCRPLASNDTDDVIRFTVGLHECGSSLQVTGDALVYSTFLLHDPRPVGNLSILRTSHAEIPIKCHYPRQGNVSSWPILPTWVPFRTTVSSEEKLIFSLHLMEEDWSTKKNSPIFQLGATARLQAEVHTGHHRPLRLFVDHCVATGTPDRSPSPHYNIVDFHGCLVDGLSDTSSAFRSPRPGPDTLQFTVDMFHFANDSRNTVMIDKGGMSEEELKAAGSWNNQRADSKSEMKTPKKLVEPSKIFITCHLKVTPADQDPDQRNKACSFSKSSNSWSPVEGSVGICECCNKGDCGILDHARRLPSIPESQRQKSSRNPRHATEEVDVTVGPLVFLGKAADHGSQGWTSSVHTSVALGVGLAMLVALTLAAVGLVLARRHHAASHSAVGPESTSQ